MQDRNRLKFQSKVNITDATSYNVLMQIFAEAILKRSI